MKCVGEALDGQKNASLGAESGGEVRSGESELQLFFADQHNGRGASADAAAPSNPPGDIRSFFGGGKGKAKAKAAAVIDLVDQQPDAARRIRRDASVFASVGGAACTFENAPTRARARCVAAPAGRAPAERKSCQAVGRPHPRAAVAAPAEDELRRAAPSACARRFN